MRFVRGRCSPMPDPSSLEAQLRCVQREIEKREKLYPRWVQEGRMNEHQMHWELNCMRAVLKTLLSLAQEQPVRLSRGR